MVLHRLSRAALVRAVQDLRRSSFQALCLAAQHAVQMLATFAEREGTLEYSDGEAFDPAVFGFRLLGDRRNTRRIPHVCSPLSAGLDTAL